MLIHIARGQQTVGAFDVSELQKKVHAGEVLLDDLAWVEGESDWQQLSALLEKLSITYSTPAATSHRLLNASEVTVPVGHSSFSNFGSASGTVKNSQLDRVAIVSGEGEGRSQGSFASYRGMEYGNISSSMRFSIETEVDTRHEFWVDDNGHETRYVFPISVPVANGQRVVVTQLSVSKGGADGEVIAFVFENSSSKKYFVYLPETNEMVEAAGKEKLMDQIASLIYLQVYRSAEKYFEQFPDVGKKWESIEIPIASTTKLSIYRFFYWTLKIAPPVGLMALGYHEKGLGGMIAPLFIGGALGYFLSWGYSVIVGNITGINDSAADYVIKRRRLIDDHFRPGVDPKIRLLLRDA